MRRRRSHFYLPAIAAHFSTLERPYLFRQEILPAIPNGTANLAFDLPNRVGIGATNKRDRVRPEIARAKTGWRILN
jgi:hypothetical protein